MSNKIRKYAKGKREKKLTLEERRRKRSRELYEEFLKMSPEEMAKVFEGVRKWYPDTEEVTEEEEIGNKELENDITENKKENG